MSLIRLFGCSAVGCGSGTLSIVNANLINEAKNVTIASLILFLTHNMAKPTSKLSLIF